jgi:hypothetical protein
MIAGLVGCKATASPSVQSYGVKVSYAQGQPLEFPDFSLEFLGQRKEADPNFSRGFLFYDFRVSRGSQVQTISWSSGTGDIGPTRFDVAGQPYLLERVYSDTLGWLEEDEMVIWKGEATP